MSSVKIVKVDFTPKCPYCERELEEVGTVSTGVLSATKVLVCPFCRKIIGTVYRA